MTKTLTMATLFTLKRTARCTLVAFVALAALPPAFAQSAGAPPYAIRRVARRG